MNRDRLRLFEILDTLEGIPSNAQFSTLQPHISVIVPVFGCASSLHNLYTRLKVVLTKINSDFEILFVDDFSKDLGWQKIVEISNQDKRVRGIRFSRNFGQHHAIRAGLELVSGDWTVVMDCDLQDPPELITDLYQELGNETEMVVARWTKRNDPWMRKIASSIWWWAYSKMSSHEINAIGNFGIYSRKSVTAIRNLRDANMSFGLSALWVGFKRKEVVLERSPRFSGPSSYSFFRLLTLGLNSVVAESNFLLKCSVFFSMFISICSLIAAIFIVIKHLLFNIPIPGWTSLIAATCLLSGLIMGSIGIVGLYIIEIYERIKQKPDYVIQQITDDRQ